MFTCVQKFLNLFSFTLAYVDSSLNDFDFSQGYRDVRKHINIFSSYLRSVVFVEPCWTDKPDSHVILFN